MVDGLIVILTCDTDYTVLTVLTDGYKTYHITSEAWTIRGVQNPNYTVPVCLCVVKIQPLQLLGYRIYRLQTLCMSEYFLERSVVNESVT